MLFRVAAALVAVLLLPAMSEIAVTARPAGYPTSCAEMDNVIVEIDGGSGPAVRHFTIRARHPAYQHPDLPRSGKADFTNCDFPPTRNWKARPFSVTLYEDDEIRLVGHRLGNSWRPDLVDFEVGGKVVHGLHLTQLSVKRDGHEVQVLVLYPADGFWRAKPLPPEGFADTGFGSSFTIGPLSQDFRSFVRLRRIGFDPATRTYRLVFASGGSATLQVAGIGRDELRLEVTMDGVDTARPFAMLSSMFVAPDNADVSRVAVRDVGSPERRVVPIDAMEAMQGAEFDFGRDAPSRHNTTAPDMVFGPFYPAR